MLKKERGSMTLEASIVVPIFVSVMLLANGFFIFFMGQQMMSNALIQSAKSLSYDPYSIQRTNSDDANFIESLIPALYDMFNAGGGNYVSSEKWYEEENIEETVKERFVLYLSPADADDLLKTFGVKDGLAGLDFSESSYSDGILTVKMNYTQEFVFNMLGLASFDDSMQVKVKMFEYKEISSGEE